jgi:hypothetical protein
VIRSVAGGGGGPPATWILRLAVADCPAESLTCRVKLNGPDCEGVPAIVPLVPPSVSPIGSAPAEIVHVYGVVPPVAATVALYAWDIVPLGKADVVIPRAGFGGGGELVVVDAPLTAPAHPARTAAQNTQHTITASLLTVVF